MKIKCIYAILNLTTDKMYIGSSNNLYKRWHIHKSTLRNNKHENSYLQRAWNKHGELDFILVIIEQCDNKNLEEREQHWIDFTKCYDRNIGYNSRLIANNNTGVKFSEETKLKISNSKKGIKWKHSDKLKLKGRNRNKEKWPHELGSKCKCEICKLTHRERNKNHMRMWRDNNRDKYNEYMRNYNKA